MRVFPTRTETMLDIIGPPAAESGAAAEEFESRMAAAVSIGRLVRPEEVAEVVAFLTSPLSVATNGDAG
ncbi:SDR family oxidoreductase [Nonomuraea sp. KM90]|uniref:SDR family oxidoreductase n=1 Tax=Nonomuraea sp. KM90 TaxID=3457428 RepID=UPI003FCEA8B8